MSSKKQVWETPPDLFDELDREFGFDLDVCAVAETAKCRRFFSPDDDGLVQTWEGVCWMNPPYGRQIGAWMKKAIEAAEAGATVVALIPARTDTVWWWNSARRGEVRFLKGRLNFWENGRPAKHAAPFPCAVVVFRPPLIPTTMYWDRSK